MPAKATINSKPNRRLITMGSLLKDKRNDAPLYLFHVVAVTVELLLQHRFFAETARGECKDQKKSDCETIDRAEQQRRGDEEQHGARVHRMTDHAVHSG